MNGRSHISKEDLQERKDSEVQAAADAIEPPGYLTKKQEKEFERLSAELIRIEIMSNLDCDALAR